MVIYYLFNTTNGNVSTVLVFVMDMLHGDLKSLLPNQLVQWPTSKKRLSADVETIP